MQIPVKPNGSMLEDTFEVEILYRSPFIIKIIQYVDHKYTII